MAATIMWTQGSTVFTQFTFKMGQMQSTELGKTTQRLEHDAGSQPGEVWQIPLCEGVTLFCEMAFRRSERRPEGVKDGGSERRRRS